MEKPIVVVSPPSNGDVDNVLSVIQRALDSAGFQVNFTANLENTEKEENGKELSLTNITVTSTSILQQQLLDSRSKSDASSLSSSSYSSNTDTTRTNQTSSLSSTKTATTIDPQYVAALERQIQEKESELDDLENHLTTALSSIKTFHVQQKELFDEFVALRDKYDTQKDRLNTAIWEVLPSAQAPLDSIPPIDMDTKEEKDSVGDYEFGASLGEGQFAKVRACKTTRETMTNKNLNKKLSGDNVRAIDLSSSVNITSSSPASFSSPEGKTKLPDCVQALVETEESSSVESKDVSESKDVNKSKELKPIRRIRRTNSVMGFSEIERLKTRYDLAVKIISKNKIQEARDVLRLNSEISTLKLLSHPNLVQLFNVIHTPKNIYLFTNRGGDDLFEWLNNKRKLNDKLSKKTVQKIMTQLISGVSALHTNGVCHRDLKPENLLLDIHDHLMIVDFGLCEKIKNGTNDKTRLLSDFCGSPGFFAPEMITAKSYDGFLCDLWSIGCILLELVIGRESFTSMWMGSYALEVLTNQSSFEKEIESRTTSVHTLINNNDDMNFYFDLLKGLLTIIPEKRLSISYLRNYKWLKINEYESNQNIKSTTTDVMVGPTLSRLSPSSSNSASTNSSEHGDVEELTSIMTSASLDQMLSDSPQQVEISNTLKSFPKKESTTAVSELTSKTTTETTTKTPPKKGLRPIKIVCGRPKSAGSSTMNQKSSFSSLASRRSQQKLNVTTSFDLPTGSASPATIKERAGQLHLPTIQSPNTPKIRGAKKILDSGTAIVRQLGLEADSPVRNSKSSPPT